MLPTVVQKNNINYTYVYITLSENIKKTAQSSMFLYA